MYFSSMSTLQTAMSLICNLKLQNFLNKRYNFYYFTTAYFVSMYYIASVVYTAEVYNDKHIHILYLYLEWGLILFLNSILRFGEQQFVSSV
jgi:hypothetical protein